MLPRMLKELRMTNVVCPTQWIGFTSKDEPFVAHYRNGHLRIWVNDELIFDKQVSHRKSQGMRTDRMLNLSSFETEWKQQMVEQLRRAKQSAKQARRFGIKLDNKAINQR